MPCLVKTLPLHRAAGMSPARQPLVSVVLSAASAVVVGACYYTAIGQWAAAAAQATLARLGSRVVGAFAVRIVPSAATIRHPPGAGAVLPGWAGRLGRWDPAGATTVAVDSSSARGSRNGHVPSVHLPTAMTGDWRTISQLRVPDETNEITGCARQLAPFDLAGIVVTAEALRTQREHVRFLTRDQAARHLLVVKDNQPSLFTALRSLP